MARTLIVAAPTALSSPTLDLVAANDTVAESVALTEQTNAKGIYTGQASTAGAGTYSGTLKTGTTVIGSFVEIVLTSADPETVRVGDTSMPQHTQRLGQSVTRTHNTTGDTLPETVTAN